MMFAKTMLRGIAALAGLAAASVATPALAQVKIGFILAATGPAASIGIHYRNAIALLPKTVGGQPAEYIFLDDQSDSTVAVKNARKLVLEDKVDVIVGSTSTPNAMAVGEVAAESRTVQLAMSPVQIPADKFAWIFSIPQPVPLMLAAVVEDMKAKNIRRVAYIGFNDSWGEIVLKGLEDNIKRSNANIQIVASERFARNDTSATGQALKMIAANPDAVMIGASGTPGALPQLALAERGFKGPVYHTHGAINREFLRVGGRAVEGAMAPTGPVIVAEQLPDANPIKKIAMEFNATYEKAHGAESRNAFAGYTFDAWAVINAAAGEAAKKAKPGTPEFRAALRDAIENAKNVVGVHGVYNFSKTDHYGTDDRARVMVQVKNGSWQLMK